ncbi:glycophorin-C isoform X3 [Coregonus clupeaformis]|nr:glycophorin-C isoform X3 [Coregonus clupeaformis]
MTQPMPTSLSEAADTITAVDYDVNDGYFDAILGAVIAAVVLVLLCLAVVVIRYMYRHKGTYHTNEAKGTEFAETEDAALRGDPALQDAMDESKKEYFI